MATLRELIIKISANSSSYQTEIARAGRMGSDFYKTMENGGKRAAAATRETQRSLSELNSQLASVKASATGMAGAFAGAFAVRELIGYTDTWNQLSGRLRLASTSSQDFANAQTQLMAISQRTGTSIQANTNLYARIAQSMRDAGFASADVAKVTETVATSLKLSGASTEEASSVITQLSQAIGSGVLRGEEFNAIMENGGRLAKLLAAGLGTTVGGLRNMANSGQLTTDKIIPLLTNVEQLRKEFATLPASISGSGQKVENSFEAWVGEENNAVGASTALAGALDGLAANMGTVANVTGTLVAIGAARYFGNMAGSIGTATGKLLENYKAQVSIASAQVYAATQTQRKAVADAGAAASAYNLALAEANVAKGTNASMLAAQNLIEKRGAMIAANTALVQSNRAVASSQTGLNNLTSVTSRIGAGASGLLSLVGGIPGAVLLGASAWYTMYQQQEAARKSAQEYASQIDQIRDKTSKMSLTDASDNRGKTVEALAEQNRLIKEQESNVDRLKRQIDELNSARGKPGITNENDVNILKAIDIETSQLAVEEQRLNQMRGQSRDIQQALEEIERRRNDLIREQGWRQNAAYQSTLMMNGAYSEFNRLMSLGNNLLTQRAGFGSGAYQGPVVSMAKATPQQSTAVEKSRRDNELASLSGLQKLHQQYVYEAQDLNLTGALYTTYIYNKDQAAQKDASSAAAKKADTAATSAQNKETREAASQAEQYSRKMADLSVATEVQQVRATQGEKAADLYAAAHQAGTKWTEAQRKEIRASSEELAKWTQRADENVRKQREQTDALKDLRDAARKYKDDAVLTADTRGLSDRDSEQYKERQQVERIFDKSNKGAEAIAARSAALDNLNKKYQATSDAEADWMAGATRGYKNWFDNISDISGTVSQGINSTLDGALTNVSSMLSSSKADWRSWGISALQTLEKVALQMAIVSAVGKGSSSSGLFGSILSGVSSYFGGSATPSAGDGALGLGTGWQSYVAHAKGGAYNSPSLSAYSDSIVNQPTLFAFAKGGVMGEAGPEAIMPLTRSADGSLGVRAVGGSNASAGAGSAPQVNITIDGNGNTTSQSTAGYQQFGSNIAQFVQQQYQLLKSRDLKPGGDIWRAIKGN